MNLINDNDDFNFSSEQSQTEIKKRGRPKKQDVVTNIVNEEKDIVTMSNKANISK